MAESSARGVRSGTAGHLAEIKLGVSFECCFELISEENSSHDTLEEHHLAMQSERLTFDQRVARQQLCKHGPTSNRRGKCVSCRSDLRANRMAG
jgi:hypothetical protein